ncbi:MAG: DUF1206 domain-containing protein [Pseudomonadota bacterium]|nr:DUF1206 domain-containing protein [Pseudomonadota bacterium]
MDVSARLTTLTRVGFAARGLVYIIIAVLVIRAGRAEDPSGALQYLAEDGGELFMMLIAAGFVAYGIWRLSDAIFNVERHQPDGTGLRERLGAGGSGVVHLLLAWQAIRLVRGDASQEGAGSQEGPDAALAFLGSHELVLPLAGLVLLGAGVFQLIKAAKASYLRHLEPRIANRDWAKWIGRLGYGARGIMFLISGYFLLKAGLQERASDAGGEQALAWLDYPWDVLVAVGLLAFGLYSLVEARFRILHDVPVEEIADGSVRPTLH